MAEKVRQIAIDKNFTVHINYSKKLEDRPDWVTFNNLRYSCGKNPYIRDGKKHLKSCPFFVMYKYSHDDEEYFLESFDEMHNHLLVPEPGIIPFTK